MSRAWGLLCAGVVLAACPAARLPHVPGDPPPAFEDDARERAYQAVLDRFTRQQAVYDHLDTRLFAQATWESPRFTETRLNRLGEFKAMGPAELAERKAQEATRLAGVTEFFLGVHANDAKLDDFDRPNTMWRLALVVGDRELAPLSVERLGRTSVEMRSVYSYMESFWVGYRVRFPSVDVPPQGMTLRLASAVGRADLVFQASP